MRCLLVLLTASVLTASVSAQVAVTNATCQTNGSFTDGPPPPTEPNGHVAWPADDPVWEFDFYRPANRTTLNGSGLEIRDVFYRGHQVFARASVPVLNVEYDEAPGGCGCFRDWQDEEAPIEVGDATLVVSCGAITDIDGYTTTQSGIALTGAGTVETACEANGPSNPTPGGDVGDFRGVAIEDYGTELVMTTHMRSSWYRYRMKWHFYDDGRIWPEFSFAATEATCTQVSHRHHAYWRFDFDLEETPDDDVVREIVGSDSQIVMTEVSRVLGGTTDPTMWSITDAATGFGYTIEPGEADRRLPVDAYSKTDALVLRYKVDEYDDGLSSSDGALGCQFAFEPFVNGESIESEDTVFWYRSGALHTGGSPFECDIVGPMLRPFGLDTALSPQPGGVVFEPARPNPFSASTDLRFQLDQGQLVTVELYDAAGRRVLVLFDGDVKNATWQTVRIDGSALPTGTYVVRVRGESASGTTRVVLVR